MMKPSCQMCQVPEVHYSPTSFYTKFCVCFDGFDSQANSRRNNKRIALIAFKKKLHSGIEVELEKNTVSK